MGSHRTKRGVHILAAVVVAAGCAWITAGVSTSVEPPIVPDRSVDQVVADAPAVAASEVAAPETPATPALDMWAAAAAGEAELTARYLEAVAASQPPPETYTPPTKTSACAPVGEATPGTEAWLDIDELGMHLPIVDGGQSVINSGVVAHYRASDWLPPVEAGEPGAYWLAAHNTCGLFQTLPSVSDGAEVVIRDLDGNRLATYRITDRATYDGTKLLAWSTFYRYGTGDEPYLILQTCVPGNRRVLMYALPA